MDPKLGKTINSRNWHWQCAETLAKQLIWSGCKGHVGNLSRLLMALMTLNWLGIQFQEGRAVVVEET